MYILVISTVTAQMLPSCVPEISEGDMGIILRKTVKLAKGSQYSCKGQGDASITGQLSMWN